MKREIIAKHVHEIHSVYFSLLLTAGLALSIVGCGGAEADTRPHQAISGEVTLDGAPLQQGQITFEPKSKADGVGAFSKISDGRFSVSRNEGPVPGGYFVRIEAIDPSTVPATAPRKPGEPKQFDPPSPKSLIPAQYNTETELDAEVKADSSNTYKFELSSKVTKKPAANKAKGSRRDKR
jgi:hypothetical protein